MTHRSHSAPITVLAALALGLAAGCGAQDLDETIEEIENTVGETVGDISETLGLEPAQPPLQPEGGPSEIDADDGFADDAEDLGDLLEAVREEVERPGIGDVAAAPPADAESALSEDEPEPASSVYVVKPGDTLGRIAAEVYGDPGGWRKLYDANRDQLASPDRVEVGMELAVP